MILCLALIFHYNGKQVPKFTAGVTLNTIISILSTTPSSAILLATIQAIGQLKWSWIKKYPEKIENFEWFDLASRGAWGSFLVLCTIKEKYVKLWVEVICKLTTRILDLLPRWVPLWCYYRSRSIFLCNSWYMIVQSGLLRLQDMPQ
jgi:hypothetical protein